MSDGSADAASVKRGRCLNAEFCGLASAGQTVAVAANSPFICPRCNEPLQSGQSRMLKGYKSARPALQIAPAVLLACGLLYYATGPFQVRPMLRLTPNTEVLTTAATLSAQVLDSEARPVAASPLPSAVVRSVSAVQTLPAATPGAVPVAPASGPAAVPPAAAQPTGVPVQGTVLLRIAGSGLGADAAVRRLAAAYLSLTGSADVKIVAGSKGVTEVAGLQAGERELITLNTSSTEAGLVALLRGRADFAIAARRASPTELERAAQTADLTTPANEYLIGLQAVAAIVNPVNRVPSLSVRQLRAVASGQIRDWAELGGAAGRVRIVAVDSQAGTADTVQDLLPWRFIETTTLVASEAAVIAAVQADTGAIGLVSHSSAGPLRALAIADGGGAVLPTAPAIAAEDYPLTQRIYLYTLQPSAIARRFASYAVSAAGQAMVESAGLVPLTVRPVPETVPDRLRPSLSGLVRLSSAFRFQGTGAELDPRAMADLTRLAGYVQSTRSASKVLLIGVPDGSGTPVQDQQLSQRMTEAVASALARVGVSSRAAALIPEWPLGDIATLEGRQRTRRVEVFISP